LIHLKRFAGFLSLFILSTFLFAMEPLPEIRGIWLSRDAVASGRTAMRAEFERIREAGYNVVFVNNWFKGGMIYESDVLESYGGIRQLSEYSGRDPLQEAIEEGHRLGLEIHAWFEYGLWNWLSYDSTDVGPVLENRRDWIMRDREGRLFSIMSGSIYQFWMDPAHPDVVTFMTEIFAECTRLYPDLDGIQTDRIRYPGTNFSFSQVSRNAYMDETGGSDPLTLSESDPEWEDFIAWRERKTSDVAKAIYEAVKNENPSCLVSAAVVPPYMLSGSGDKLQDWPTWAREGSVDLLCPMLYGLHPDISSWLNRCLDEFNSPLRFAPGFDIGSVTLSTLASTVSAIRKQGMAGAVTWYYGDLTDDKKDYFRDNIYSRTTPSFHVSPTVDDVDSHYTCSGNMSLTTGGYKNYYHTGTSGSSFKWDIPLYVSGEYTLQTFIPEEWTGADTLYYRIEYNDQAEFVSVPKLEAAGWLTLLKRNFQYDDSVRVILTGSNTGLIAADAVRLMKKVPLNILEGFTPDEQSLRLLFNNTLNSETGNDIACFSIEPPIHIYSVTVDPIHPAVLTLNTAGFESGIKYELHAFGLTEADGTISGSLFFEFQYFSGLDTVIDNSDSYFTVQSGTWISESDTEGYTGTDYLTTPVGDGTARVFWRYAPPVSGLYRITALFPAGPDFVTDAMYILKNGTVYDTLFVDQSKSGENSAVLGTQWLDAGTYAVVKLHNESPQSPGKKVAADAIRISRVFPSSIKEKHQLASLPASFEMTQNYPNPFNNRTHLTYSLRKAGEVIVRIFNIRGQQIRYIKKIHLPGEYSLDLDFSAESSGIYIYHVSALGVNIKGKMLYIK
jgi:uncharacterized lipoprotein YddW (UPF0748 family)